MNKLPLRLPLTVLFATALLYGCVLTPAIEVTYANIVLLNSVLFDILDFFLNLFEALWGAAAVGFLVYGVYTCGAKRLTPLYLITGGALLFKYLSALISIFIVRGSIDLTYDYPSLIVSLLQEVALAALAVLLAHRFAGYTDAPAETPHIPFSRLFSRTNPLQRAVFWSLIAQTALRLISFMVADLTAGIDYRFADVPVTLIYIVLLILLPAFVGYLFSLFLIRFQHKDLLRTQ